MKDAPNPTTCTSQCTVTEHVYEPAPKPVRAWSPSEVLYEMPAKIRGAENERWSQAQISERLRVERKLLEADAMVSVAAEVGEDGKKRHTNAEARDGAVRTYLAKDPGAQDLGKRIEDVQVFLAKIDSTLEYLRNVQRNARVLLLARDPLGAFLDAEDGGHA